MLAKIILHCILKADNHTPSGFLKRLPQILLGPFLIISTANKILNYVAPVE